MCVFNSTGNEINICNDYMSNSDQQTISGISIATSRVFISYIFYKHTIGIILPHSSRSIFSTKTTFTCTQCTSNPNITHTGRALVLNKYLIKFVKLNSQITLNLRAGQDRFDHEIITMRTMEYNICGTLYSSVWVK